MTFATLSSFSVNPLKLRHGLRPLKLYILIITLMVLAFIVPFLTLRGKQRQSIDKHADDRIDPADLQVSHKAEIKMDVLSIPHIHSIVGEYVVSVEGRIDMFNMENLEATIVAFVDKASWKKSLEVIKSYGLDITREEITIIDKMNQIPFYEQRVKRAQETIDKLEKAEFHDARDLIAITTEINRVETLRQSMIYWLENAEKLRNKAEITLKLRQVKAKAPKKG